MPRAGLTADVVARTAADLADEAGLAGVSMAAVAARLGVRPPSLYKHVAGQADLHRRVAAVALTDLDGLLRDALQGRAGRDALVAAAGTLRAFALRHPGRHAATVRLDPGEADDPAAVAGDRVLAALATVVRGYGVSEGDTVPALRMLRSLLHGFTTIEAAGGFQLEDDVDASFDWAVDFLDAGLRRPPGP